MLRKHSVKICSVHLETVWIPITSMPIMELVAKTLSILSLVALCILLLAVINFVNIMIGTSSYRIREIGLRKVFGGRRGRTGISIPDRIMVLTLFAAAPVRCILWIIPSGIQRDSTVLLYQP